jgi:hypothetical protein
LKYEVILVRYVPELVYCQVDEIDETEAVKKAKQAAKLPDPSNVVEMFFTKPLTECAVKIGKKAISVRELTIVPSSE